jgi:gluconate 5-dehydrogenase/3-oxoacyl-[acyl-carrier protein] reductase
MPQPDLRADPFGLAGQWVFVAGATGQMGRSTAAALAGQRARLVLHASRHSAALAALAGDLRGLGAEVLPAAADITDPDQVGALPDRLRAAGADRLRALVNCTTGYGGRPLPLADLPATEFRRVVDVDLVGSFLLVQGLLPLLGKGAKVVLFSSVAGLRGRPGAAHLVAAKAGVQGLVLALARDLAERGVYVNAVAPGPIAHRDGNAPSNLGPGVAVSTPAEVADLAVFLASERSGPVQGQILVVNGGQP